LNVYPHICLHIHTPYKNFCLRYPQNVATRFIAIWKAALSFSTQHIHHFFCLLFLQCSLFIVIVYIKNENGRICSWNANNKNNECVHYLLISINRNKEREKSKAKNYLSVYIKTNTAYLSEWEEVIVGKFMARIVFGAFLGSLWLLTVLTDVVTVWTLNSSFFYSLLCSQGFYNVLNLLIYWLKN